MKKSSAQRVSPKELPFNDAAQLNLWEPSSPPSSKNEFIVTESQNISSVKQVPERMFLEKSYGNVFETRFDLRQLVTYVPNKNIPVYNWFKYKEAIQKFDPPARDFLMLGLISILEQISYTSKDGQFLRLVDKKIPPVKNVLERQLRQMLEDLRQQKQLLFPNGNASAEIFEGDARESCLPEDYWGKIAGVITSPPYLNRYDYSRTYSLELCTISVETFDELRDIRHRLLRSHIESKEHKGKEIDLPAIDEILKALEQKKLNNSRIPIMIRGYFEDMNLVIKNLSLYLKPGGKVALVVANARFEGEYVPTDLILCELAKLHGLKTEKIWITRFKGNSSQQMAKYGRQPVRETIVFWRKSRGK